MDQNNINTKTDKIEVVHTQEIDNPYFTNQKGFADRLDAERANTASWKFITFMSNIITVVAVVGCIYAANLPNVVPFIFKEDGSGGLTAMGIANEEMHVDKQMVANQIALFIVGLREIPTSVEIKKRYVTRVEMMSTPALFHNVLAKQVHSLGHLEGKGGVLHIVRSQAVVHPAALRAKALGDGARERDDVVFGGGEVAVVGGLGELRPADFFHV